MLGERDISISSRQRVPSVQTDCTFSILAGRHTSGREPINRNPEPSTEPAMPSRIRYGRLLVPPDTNTFLSIIVAALVGTVPSLTSHAPL